MAWQLLGTKQGNPQPDRVLPSGPVTLNFWGVYDDPAIFEPIIQAYQANHPNVRIQYTRKDFSLYEFVSLNLLASQEGPDVWLIPSEWLPRHADKLGVTPEGFLAKQNLPPAKKGLFQKAPALPTNAALFSQLFAPLAAENNLQNNQIKAIPLSVDSLGLFSNRQKLQEVGINRPPSTWEEVVSDVQKLAKRKNLNLEQPAINLGTSNNVARASDILAALMIQNHTSLVDSTKTEALFNQTIAKATGEPVQPGAAALDFYTSFASPTKENFSWSASQPQDYDLFLDGKLPLFIDYSYRVRDILQQRPGLAFDTSPLPQITQTEPLTSLGTALMVGVPSVSRNQSIAWNFIQFLTNKDNSLAYARATGRPPARLELVQVPNLFEPRLKPFIVQVPFAVNWYRNEINKSNDVFKKGIDAVLAGQSIIDVTDKLTKQVTHILRNEPYE